MVFSTECDTNNKRGKAIFVPFANNPVSLADLKTHAVNLIRAEYKREALHFDTYHWNWAALGLLVNPGSESKNEIDLLIDNWKDNYKQFDETRYRVGREVPVLDKSGMFQIAWPAELQGFDFMIAAATMPNVEEYPSAKNIADRMCANGYDEYYKMNQAVGICTSQDAEIDEFLNLNKL